MPEPTHLCQYTGCTATATAQLLWDDGPEYCRLCAEHTQGVDFGPAPIAEGI